MQLAQVAQMDFRREKGVPALGDVVDADPDELVGLVHRAVEQHVVIGHVEMAVVVDPGRLHAHH